MGAEKGCRGVKGPRGAKRFIKQHKSAFGGGGGKTEAVYCGGRESAGLTHFETDKHKGDRKTARGLKGLKEKKK